MLRMVAVVVEDINMRIVMTVMGAFMGVRVGMAMIMREV